MSIMIKLGSGYHSVVENEQEMRHTDLAPTVPRLYRMASQMLSQRPQSPTITSTISTVHPSSVSISVGEDGKRKD
jgi:hypothetical protein